MGMGNPNLDMEDYATKKVEATDATAAVTPAVTEETAKTETPAADAVVETKKEEE